MTAGYLERLAARSAAVGSVLCVGIDPTPGRRCRTASRAGLAGVERFARLIVEAAAPFAAAMKPNLAFFEAFGSAGLAALERVRAAIPAGIPVIADAKRGDVETTVARQAVALFDASAWTRSRPARTSGLGALEPFLERSGRFTYVLCRTSNPAAGELQDLVVAADPARASRPSRSTGASRGSWRRPGWATARASSSARRRRPSWPAIRRAGARAWRSSCRAWARRVARPADVLADGRARRRSGRRTAGRRAARQRLAGHRRRGAREAVRGSRRTTRVSGSPAPRARGPPDCLCYAESAASRDPDARAPSGPDPVVRGSPRCRTSAPSSWSSSW